MFELSDQQRLASSWARICWPALEGEDERAGEIGARVGVGATGDTESSPLSTGAGVETGGNGVAAAPGVREIAPLLVSGCVGMGGSGCAVGRGRLIGGCGMTGGATTGGAITGAAAIGAVVMGGITGAG